MNHGIDFTCALVRVGDVKPESAEPRTGSLHYIILITDCITAAWTLETRCFSSRWTCSATFSAMPCLAASRVENSASMDDLASCTCGRGGQELFASAAMFSPMYIRTQKVKLGLEWASSRIRVDPALLHAACWHLWNSPKIAGNNKSRSKAVAPPSIRSGSDPAVPGHTRVFWTHCHGCSKEADKQENRTVKKQRQISHKENAKQTVYSDQFEGKKRCYCRTLDPWPNILDAKSCHRTRSQKSAAFGGFKLVPQNLSGILGGTPHVHRGN